MGSVTNINFDDLSEKEQEKLCDWYCDLAYSFMKNADVKEYFYFEVIGKCEGLGQHLDATFTHANLTDEIISDQTVFNNYFKREAKELASIIASDYRGVPFFYGRKKKRLCKEEGINRGGK